MTFIEGQKYKIDNLDNIDPDNFPLAGEDLIGREVIFDGQHDSECVVFESYDEDDNPTFDTAYRFVFEYESEELYIWLFHDNLKMIKKKTPKNEIEFLDAIQRNFKE